MNSAFRFLSVLLTVGMTAGAAPAPVPALTFPIVEEEAYFPIPEKVWRTEPGSALDLSFLQDAPAGKYGRLVVQNGHFAFAKRPAVRVRFYGVNLCNETQFLSHAESDRLADQLARMGYNAVRFHHYDQALVEKSPDSTTIDPDAMDKLDYLAAALKKRGIYFTTDFYCSRKIRRGDFPELPEASERSIKVLVMLLPSAMDNWKRFTRNLLTHRNPYTGLTWAEEPALITASMINEDAVFHVWEKPEWKTLFEARFDQMHSGWRQEPDPAKKRALQATMLLELQKKAYDEMRRFVREDLACPVLTGGSNYKNAEAQSFLRESFDYVDNHSYYNHPTWRQEGKRTITKSSAVNPVAAGFRVFRDCGNARIFGKPFTITETNYLPPNRFRASGGAMLGIMGGFQDYDGIFRFDYAHNRARLTAPQGLSTFHVAQDPVNELSERMGILLFLRGEIPPAPERNVWLYDRSAFLNFEDFSSEAGRFPGAFGWLVLQGQIGCGPRAQVRNLAAPHSRLFIGKNAAPLPGAVRWKDLPAPEMKPAEFKFQKAHFAFAGKQRILYADSPFSEVLCLPPGKKRAGRWFSAENFDGYATIFLSAIDGKGIADSRRMLLMHLTDVQNSGTRFLDKERSEMCSGGKLPLRLRGGRAALTLHLPGRMYRVYALDLSGARLREIPVREKRVVLDVAANGGVLAYEVIRMD